MKGDRARVLLAKPAFDCHDIGAKVLAVMLRDAGIEVIYTGQHRSVETIVSSAVQEDADIIGMSILTDPPVPIMKKIRGLLEEKGAEDIHLLVGGISSPSDREILKKQLGVAEVYGPGTPFETIVECIRTLTAR